MLVRMKVRKKEKQLLDKIAYQTRLIERQRRLLEEGRQEQRELTEGYEWVLKQLQNTSAAVKKTYKNVVYELSQKQAESLRLIIGLWELEISRLLRGIDADEATALQHRNALLQLRRRRSRRS